MRVQVMIPSCSDSPFTDLISDSYIGDLLDAGVELYRYDNGFLHAKLLIVDEDTASVGRRTWITAACWTTSKSRLSSATGASCGRSRPPTTTTWPRAAGSRGKHGGPRRGGAHWVTRCGWSRP
ncbi:MAG: phospholipase D-like domain-containing protein [Alistipes onderdonkii]